MSIANQLFDRAFDNLVLLVERIATRQDDIATPVSGRCPAYAVGRDAPWSNRSPYGIWVVSRLMAQTEFPVAGTDKFDI